jgi:hypothetical protein
LDLDNRFGNLQVVGFVNTDSLTETECPCARPVFRCASGPDYETCPSLVEMFTCDDDLTRSRCPGECNACEAGGNSGDTSSNNSSSPFKDTTTLAVTALLVVLILVVLAIVTVLAVRAKRNRNDGSDAVVSGGSPTAEESYAWDSQVAASAAGRSGAGKSKKPGRDAEPEYDYASGGAGIASKHQQAAEVGIASAVLGSPRSKGVIDIWEWDNEDLTAPGADDDDDNTLASSKDDGVGPVFSTAIGDAMMPQSNSSAAPSKKPEYMEVRSQFTAGSKPAGAPSSSASSSDIADGASHAGGSAKCSEEGDVLGDQEVLSRIALARSMFHNKANTLG